jgi:tryptophanyl-tRNA synthetase
MSIVTDSAAVEAPKPTEGSGLYQLLKLFAPEGERVWVETAFRDGGIGYGDMKVRLFEWFLATFGQARTRYDELTSDRGELERILADGASRAREAASKVIDRARHATGIR